MHCRQLKFGMLIEQSVWHTVVKVHKNNYVSFCYRIFGNTTVKTMAEIILKCYCWHTKLTCFIGIAMKLTCYYQHTGYFLGARPASLAHNISYWRTTIPTFGPLGAPGAHRFTFRWALMSFLHSLKCKVFVMLARTLIQRAGLFPRCHDHFVTNATRLPRSEFPCYVGDIQPLTAYPTIPLALI